MAQSSCLTNTQLMRILSGSLTTKESTHAEDHLDQCADCMTLLVDLVKVVPAQANVSCSSSHHSPPGSQTDEFKPVLDE